MAPIYRPLYRSNAAIGAWLFQLEPTPTHKQTQTQAQTPARKRKRDDDDVPSPPVTNPIIQTCESPGSQSAELRAVYLGLDRIRGPRLAYFDDDRKPPPTLFQYAMQLESLADDKRFLWPDLQLEITGHTLKSTLFRRLSNPVWYAFPDSPPHAGPTPMCADLEELVIAARGCGGTTTRKPTGTGPSATPPPSWASPSSRIRPRLRAANGRNVPISTEYHALQGPLLSSHHAVTSNVDYCIVIDQSRIDPHPIVADMATSSASVNHTDDLRFRSDPIAIGVVAKAASSSPQEEAEFQMGSWFAAHFAHLHALLDRQWGERPGRGPDDVWQGAVDELGFLPGILVLGHVWYFVAATWAPPERDADNKHSRSSVTLWGKIPIGSTDTPEGVCHIISVVRGLAVWVEDVYWPWFCRWALGDDLED